MMPWQQDLLIKMAQYKGKGVVQITGRRSGKSQWTSQAIDRLMQDILSIPISDLKLNEGTVYGKRYYTVEPIGGNWRAIEDWCIETYGSTSGSIWAEEVNKSAPTPGERWYANNRKFWFRNEQDRTMFVLKWR